MIVTFGPHTITFPASWQQVTLGQFIALSTGELTVLKTLQTLADQPELIELIPDPMAGQQILASLDYLSTPPDFVALPCPVTLTIGGKLVVLPESIALETLGQKLAADEATKELENYDYITPALALMGIYLYPALSGQPFTSLSDYEVYNADLLKLPVTDALPVAAFFLSKYQRLIPSGRVTYRAAPEPIRPRWKRLAAWCRNWMGTLSMSLSTG